MGEVNLYDVLVYGATSAGIAASIQVARMGRKVLLVCPENRIGGLTTNGLGQTDIGSKEIFGGLSREFYRRVRNYYDDSGAWLWERQEDYQDGGQVKGFSDHDVCWTFEPKAALKVFEEMLEEAKVTVVYNKKLDRENGVQLENGRIHTIEMLTGENYHADIFIDTTYEGDLMAASGVSYTIGRESNADYGETLNGVQKEGHGTTLAGNISSNAINHQLMPGVDPYIEAGNSTSGLLPGIDPFSPGEEGSGDDLIQAYCFRLCLTDHPENRVPFFKPKNYDLLEFELLLRNIEKGEAVIPLIHSSMPNRKTDSNNRRGVSTDYIGQNYTYPEASYEDRQKIYQKHLEYTQGLMWTLANHSRVPQSMRQFFNEWGVCSDEFVENGGWPIELYVREARRMRSDYVMTQKNCEGIEVASDSIGMAAYAMDSHHVCRYVGEDGCVHNEGNVQAEIKDPYPISYRSIVPMEREVKNLLVPVCLSATHIAFGSIRMEPVFMVLGQSAAIAAVLALKDRKTVQEVSYDRLRELLIEAGQVLDRPDLMATD